MAAAAGTVGTAEARDRRRQFRERGCQLALVSAGKNPRAEDRAYFRETVDVPSNGLAAAHVSAQPRPEAARPARRAAVKVAARAQANRRLTGQRHRHRTGQFHRQDIGARPRGGVAGARAENPHYRCCVAHHARRASAP